MLKPIDRIIKRIFDIVFSIMGIVLTWWIMLLAWIIASIDTRSNGLFVQKRIGKNARPFLVFKIKTMKKVEGIHTSITTAKDIRITTSGIWLRKTKIDELPQLFNILFGNMSFVGPRPDVAGFADLLQGGDRIILSVCPGITGPATLKYKNEEKILSQQENPQQYNNEIIWPDKVAINKKYISHWSLKKDIIYIMKTILGS
jgi:lipopolysaccharide/colanic/teichoic acid biosynthesis glycosyltransferase